jgi:hypothetical protein
MESLKEFGPVWTLVGLLFAANVKLVFCVIDLVKNNTTALQKLTDIVTRCSKNGD